MNIGYRSSGYPDRSGSILKGGLHKHNVSRIYGNICSRSYGYSDIGAGKGGSIVYTVSDHDHPAVFLKHLNIVFLLTGKDFRNGQIDSGNLSYAFSSPFVVTCKHDCIKAHFLKLFNSFTGICTDSISHRDNSQKLSV